MYYFITINLVPAAMVVGGLGIPNLTWKFLILCLRKRFLGKNIPMRVIVKELKKLAHGRISKSIQRRYIWSIGHYHYTWQLFSLYLL
jgi:hypothetical protein